MFAKNMESKFDLNFSSTITSNYAV